MHEVTDRDGGKLIIAQVLLWVLVPDFFMVRNAIGEVRRLLQLGSGRESRVIELCKLWRHDYGMAWYREGVLD